MQRTILALIACFLLVISYAVFCAAMGWKALGGFIPVALFLWALTATWKAIRGSSSLPSSQLTTASNDKPSVSEGAHLPSPPCGTSDAAPEVPALRKTDAYAMVAQELNEGHYEQGLWLKCYSEADGDDIRAGAAYNRERARMLMEEAEKTRIESERNSARVHLIQAQKARALPPPPLPAPPSIAELEHLLSLEQAKRSELINRIDDTSANGIEILKPSQGAVTPKQKVTFRSGPHATD